MTAREVLIGGHRLSPIAALMECDGLIAAAARPATLRIVARESDDGYPYVDPVCAICETRCGEGEPCAFCSAALLAAAASLRIGALRAAGVIRRRRYTVRVGRATVTTLSYTADAAIARAVERLYGSRAYWRGEHGAPWRGQVLRDEPRSGCTWSAQCLTPTITISAEVTP